MNEIKNDIGDIFIGTMGQIFFFVKREDNTDK